MHSYMAIFWFAGLFILLKIIWGGRWSVQALTLIKMPATHIPGPGRSRVSETKQNSSLLCHSSWKEKAVKARNKISQVSGLYC